MHLTARLDRLESAVARARHRADTHDMADAMARRASVAVWYRNKKRMCSGPPIPSGENQETARFHRRRSHALVRTR